MQPDKKTAGDGLPGDGRPEGKRLLASAIKIAPGEGEGPRLVGSGVGKLAEKIIEIARENAIPVVEDDDLAKSLRLVEVGANLPEELFPVVAEIIAHIYHVAELHRPVPINPKKSGD